MPNHQLLFVGDGVYAVMELLAATMNEVTWIVRFRLDAALFDFPPPYQKGQMGRPPIKGKKQPALSKRLLDSNTTWHQVHFSQWYNQNNKLMLVTSGTAIWYRAGKPVVPIKWVIVRDPDDKMDPFVIACTDLELSSIQIVEH